MTRPTVRVVKVGGSLLNCRRLGTSLRRWLHQQPPAHHLLVTGGGPFADQVRQTDHKHHLGPRDAHWLAVRTMTITARWVANRLLDAVLVTGDDPLPAPVAAGRVTVLDPWAFLRHREPHQRGICLPESWDVTSDSIAARVALVVDAKELVLLKSALPAADATVDQLTADGYVDRFFKELVDQLPPTRLVDFRTGTFPSIMLDTTER